MRTIIEYLTTDYAHDKLDKFISTDAQQTTQKLCTNAAAILSLNILPINVHALQRFIPFANIYNYSL